MISLLAPDTSGKAITKKEACEMLNISYNTARLQRIIDDYNDKKEFIKIRKSQNRGRAASSQEISEAVTQFLSGSSVAEIARSLFRSPSFVRGIINRVGVPEKNDDGIDYLPDECRSEDFEEGEIVWSARHHCPAIVKKEISVDYQAERMGFSDVNYESKYSSKCYAIYVIEEVRELEDQWARVSQGGYSAFTLAYDLGKLTHLEQYGVNLSRI